MSGRFVSLRDRLINACHSDFHGRDAMSSDEKRLCWDALEEAGIVHVIRHPDGGVTVWSTAEGAGIVSESPEFWARVDAAIERICARGVA